MIPAAEPRTWKLAVVLGVADELMVTVTAWLAPPGCRVNDEGENVMPDGAPEKEIETG